MDVTLMISGFIKSHTQKKNLPLWWEGVEMRERGYAYSFHGDIKDVTAVDFLQRSIETEPAKMQIKRLPIIVHDTNARFKRKIVIALNLVKQIKS